MVYSLGTISTNHVCPKAKTIIAVQVKSGQAVKLNPRCNIRTKDHVITADKTEDKEVHSKWLDWTWLLGGLFQQPENKIVTAAIQKLCTQISGKFDADILLCELNYLAKEVNPDHWTFTLPGGMITGAMIIFLIVLCCWMRCSQESQLTNYPTPSALPAPLILNQHLDPINR
jgi:hypothetical protein